MIVPDVTAPSIWGEIVNGVDGIVHVATDMSFGADPKLVITPMVNSVRNLLEAAAKEASVKRFVITGSNRAVYNATIGHENTLDAGT